MFVFDRLLNSLPREYLGMSTVTQSNEVSHLEIASERINTIGIVLIDLNLWGTLYISLEVPFIFEIELRLLHTSCKGTRGCSPFLMCKEIDEPLV